MPFNSSSTRRSTSYRQFDLSAEPRLPELASLSAFPAQESHDAVDACGGGLTQTGAQLCNSNDGYREAIIFQGSQRHVSLVLIEWEVKYLQYP
jgi:hypothetical protein